MWVSSSRFVFGALGLVLCAAGCTPLATQTSGPPEEHIPGPASVWLTSDPAAPAIPVSVTMTSPDEPSLLFSHTFAPGAAVRGDFATSEGRYRLAALGENCVLDLTLGPSDVADVVLAIEGSSCGLEVLRVRSMDDPTTWTHQPAVLITNRGVGSKTPAIEPRPSSLP